MPLSNSQNQAPEGISDTLIDMHNILKEIHQIVSREILQKMHKKPNIIVGWVLIKAMQCTIIMATF